MKNLAFIPFFLILISCTHILPAENFEQRILGVWYLMDYDERFYENSVIGFTPDGRKCVVATKYNYSGKPSLTYWNNTYVIEKNTLLTTVQQNSGGFNSGRLITDHILKLSETELEILMKKSTFYTPKLEKHVRLTDENPYRICNIVEDYFAQQASEKLPELVPSRVK